MWLRLAFLSGVEDSGVGDSAVTDCCVVGT